MAGRVDTIREWVIDARRRTLAVVGVLAPDELLGPRSPLVNPPLWELGHVAWFQERFALRHGGAWRPLRADGDALYDSAAIPHDTRWSLPLPSLDETAAYLCAVRDAVLERLADPALDLDLVVLGVLHEDMHAEAMAFTRQTLGSPRPPLGAPRRAVAGAGPVAGDVVVPGGPFELGARPEEPIALDNERWAHAVELAPFAIARAPVTQREYRAFVEDDGYARPELWTAEGWRWREAVSAEHPIYWRREGPEWLRRDFDAWVPLEPDRPVVNVSWHEAGAWCRWAGRRLPSEAEWEAAASRAPPHRGRAAPNRRYPWGDEPATPDRAHLDFASLEPVDVAELPGGDAASGCRQLLGNVWEWTASAFLPYPGFVPGAYREYSEPWFGTHRVLRGGSFATTSRVARCAFRNFYTPDRRDPWIGFRTCAL